MSRPEIEKSIKPGAVGRVLTREEVGPPIPRPVESTYNPRDLMDRIAALEARNAALEARVAALEGTP